MSDNIRNNVTVPSNAKLREEVKRLPLSDFGSPFSIAVSHVYYSPKFWHEKGQK
jgi:hypothetical protein